MSDLLPLLPALAERLESVKWTCDLCRKGFPSLQHDPLMHYGTQALGMIPNTPCRCKPDWPAVAREALAVVAERLPTEDELAAIIPKISVYVSKASRWEMLPDTISARRLLRDLRGRLGVKG